MNVEGLLIKKTAYKDKDLIGTLLLRSGCLLDVYFYGGRGGGKKAKGSILEIGHMLKLTLSRSSYKTSDTRSAKEYSLLWHSDQIRQNHQAFYSLCFMFELLQKVAVEEDLEHSSGDFQGLFKVISNVIFYMDKDLSHGQFDMHNSLVTFLMKLLEELGAMPNIFNCGLCESDLQKVQTARFESHESHFICIECVRSKGESFSGNLELVDEMRSYDSLRKKFELSSKLAIKDLEFSKTNNIEVMSVFRYFCYHFGFEQSQFKSWSLLMI